jgi:hypothetical protein
MVEAKRVDCDWSWRALELICRMFIAVLGLVWQ